MQDPELPSYDAFYSKWRGSNTPKAEYMKHVNVIKSGMTDNQAVAKLKLSIPPPSGVKNSQYLQETWKQEHMKSFKDSMGGYNNKYVVFNLKANQKTTAFYNNKDIDMLKLDCTLYN